MDGYLLVDKPVGWTSFDVVNYIRKMVAEAEGKRPKQVKVGHSGTLDPFATGLLIILIGKYTKRQDEFMKQDKTYEATITLGSISTTGDPEGEITQTDFDEIPTKDEVMTCLNKFVGQIEQIPPQFSAIKVGGKKAYELARSGKPVELKSRRITIHSLQLISYEWPEVKIRTQVSSGTYIRSLAVDIGGALGTGAYCSRLRRTKIAEYEVERAKTIDKISSSVI